MRDRVATAHIHDNHGEKDEHLLPFEGVIDWDAALAAFATAPEPIALVFELKDRTAGAPSLDQIRAAFDKFENHFGENSARAAGT